MKSDEIWRFGSGVRDLPARTVDVWRIPLEIGANELAAREALLAAEERARAARFHFERDRRRYIAAHGRLRSILARYTQTAPRELRLSVGERGKPALVDSPVWFNLSHSGELALLAVTEAAEVGVDVEHLRSVPDALQIARRYFAPAEVAQLEGDEHHQAFFRAWTRKEAYLKAIGTGLAFPLERVEVSLSADASPRLVHIAGDDAEAARWTLAEPPVGPDYMAAVALRAVGTAFRWLTCDV